MNNNPPDIPKIVYSELIKTAYVSKYIEKKACVVCLPVDVHERMLNELYKQNIDMETFMYGACMKYLKEAENKEMLNKAYLYFSDLRITDDTAPSSDLWNSWSIGSDDVENQQDDSRSRSDD